MKFLRLAYNYNPGRYRIRTYVPKVYQAIPHFYKPVFQDIHDTYQLRTKEQINNQLKDKEFTLDLKILLFPTDLNKKVKERKVWLIFDIRQFSFTHLQLQRLKTIMGPRFQENKYIQQVAIDMYPQLEENAAKAEEILYELIFEAKRAP